MSNLHNFKKFKLLKRNINNINYNIFKKIDFFIHLAAVSSVDKANNNQ